MKRKEIEQLAKKIITYENIIQNSTDPKEIKQAKAKILTLSSSIKSLDEMAAVDEVVQQILNKT